MRYLQVDDIIFTDINGNSYTIKDTRDILQEPIVLEVDKYEDELLDEIAAKKDVYGEFGEQQTYRLFDANIVKIVESNYDLSKVKKIKVPKW